MSSSDAPLLETPAMKPTRPEKSRAIHGSTLSYRLRVHLARALLLGGFVGFWEIGVRAGWLDPFFFPAPTQIISRVRDWMITAELWSDLGTTLLETILSFLGGIALGTSLGIWLGLSRFASDVLQPFIKVVNAIPRVLLAPIFVIWFGLGLASKVALGLMIVVFIAFFNTYQGIREVNPVVLANARLLKASRWALLRHVYLPSATSFILSSLRVSVGMAVLGAVVAEYLGSSAGLGHRISEAEGVMDATGVFAGLVILSVFVVGIDALVDALERRLLVWRPVTAHEHDS
ncbi:NitT/TauT family transport system permease protein [Bradyrhizobium sp. S3.3.6]